MLHSHLLGPCKSNCFPKWGIFCLYTKTFQVVNFKDALQCPVVCLRNLVAVQTLHQLQIDDCKLLL